MPIDQKTRKALDIKKLRLPSIPTVSALQVEEYTDSTGDPALRVRVILDESTDIEKLSGEAIGDLKAAIRESLRKHGVTKFPYIFLAKQSELAGTDEE
jgi:hypothetical protein